MSNHFATRLVEKLKADKIVLAAIFLYTLLLTSINFLQYSTFEYKDFDLAIHAQTMHNILHGSIYSSILGVDFIGNHANIILFLIAPIYFLFAHPITLIVLQAFCLSFALYPIYLICKTELNQAWAGVIAFLYFIYPPLIFVNLFEFHPTVFATLFLSFMFYFFIKKNFRLFVLFTLLALTVQENIPLVIFPIGIYALIKKRELRWVLFPGIVSVFWFIFVIFFFIPHFNQNTIQFSSIYRYLGPSIPEAIRQIITQPQLLFKVMFCTLNGNYLWQLFAPLLFLPLLDLSFLIIIPSLLQHALSARVNEHTIYFHYTAEIIPLLFFSTVYVLKKLQSSSTGKRMSALLWSLVVISLFISFPYHSRIVNQIKNFQKTTWDVEREKLLAQIPPQASVVATFEFLPKLSQREKIYSFHHVVLGSYTLSTKNYKLPTDVEYALVNFLDEKTFGDFYLRNRAEKNLQDFFAKNQWGIVSAVDSLVLFKKNSVSDFVLYKNIVGTLPPEATPLNTKFNDELELVGYTTDARNYTETGCLRMSFFWMVKNKTDRDYVNIIGAIGKNGTITSVIVKPICYRIYPTYTWESNTLIREDYNLLLPQEVPPINTFILQVFDTNTGKIAPTYSKLNINYNEPPL